MLKVQNKPLLIDERGGKVTVDRAKHIVYGVKAAGMSSKNGWSFTRECLKDAVGCYNTTIDIHHQKSGGNPAVSERFAKAFNARFENDGIYVDVKYLPSHVLADSFCDACEDPDFHDLFGLSHEIDDYDISKTGVVSNIRHIKRLALVSTPACTHGLFDEVKMSDETAQEAATLDKEVVSPELTYLRAKDACLVLCDELNIAPDRQLLDAAAYLPAEKRKEFLTYVVSKFKVSSKPAQRAVLVDEKASLAAQGVQKPMELKEMFDLVTGK